MVVFNYRGFGKSKTLDSSGKQIGTPLSEQSLYEDGMEMYKYVRDVMGVAPANITTMYNAAKEHTNSSFMAYFGSRGSGDYNTRENMQRLHQNDPDIPVAYISGTRIYPPS